MPSYYTQIIKDEKYWGAKTQFFKIKRIVSLPKSYYFDLILEKNKKQVRDVIKETRTAVMFVENTVDFEIDNFE